MKLKSDWKTVLRKAWSMKFIGLSTLLSAAEVALPYLDPGLLPAGYLAGLAMVITVAAGVSRLVVQKDVP